MQPTITPLYDGKSPAEILSLLFDAQPKAGLELLTTHWQGGQDAAAFTPKWQDALGAGFIAGTAFPPEDVTATPQAAAPPAPAAKGLTVLFRPDPTIWDGRPANNGWLQELPKPLTKLVWENALFISPALAARRV